MLNMYSKPLHLNLLSLARPHGYFLSLCKDKKTTEIIPLFSFLTLCTELVKNR